MTCNFVEKKFLLFFNRKRLNYNTQESFPILQHFQRHCTEYSVYSFYSYISYFTVVHNSLFFSCLVRKWPSFLLIYASMGYNYHMEVGLKQTEFSPNLFLNCVNLSQAKFHNFVTFSQKFWKKCRNEYFRSQPYKYMEDEAVAEMDQTTIVRPTFYSWQRAVMAPSYCTYGTALHTQSTTFCVLAY